MSDVYYQFTTWWWIMSEFPEHNPCSSSSFKTHKEQDGIKQTNILTDWWLFSVWLWCEDFWDHLHFSLNTRTLLYIKQVDLCRKPQWHISLQSVADIFQTNTDGSEQLCFISTGVKFMSCKKKLTVFMLSSWSFRLLDSAPPRPKGCWQL